MEIEDTGDGVASIRDKLLSHNLEIISMKSRNNGQMGLFRIGPLCKIAEELQRDATDEPAQRQSAHQTIDL